MTSPESKRLAAVEFSKALSEHGVRHAFIGGFAVNLLGSRRFTDDIDVEIDLPRDATRQRVLEITAHNPRFQQQGLGLVFQPEDRSLPTVPIETLPAGELGLPQTFEAMQVGHDNLPVLPPGILVLTKIKRCVNNIGSTRPKTVRRLENDLKDIVHLLEWLVANGEKIDFVGYHSSNVERLYTAVQQLVAYWRSSGRGEYLDMLKSTLLEDDAQKVMADPEVILQSMGSVSVMHADSDCQDGVDTK